MNMAHLLRYVQPSPFDVALQRLMDQFSHALHLNHFDPPRIELKKLGVGSLLK